MKTKKETCNRRQLGSFHWRELQMYQRGVDLRQACSRTHSLLTMSLQPPSDRHPKTGPPGPAPAVGVNRNLPEATLTPPLIVTRDRNIEGTPKLAEMPIAFFRRLACVQGGFG